MIASQTIARDVVATQPDVILSTSTRLALALQSETRTIPNVAWMTDPVAAGIASSLAHPGGNVTGISVDAGSEIGGKYLELFSASCRQTLECPHAGDLGNLGSAV